jgi:hypothetical protein
MTSVIYADDEEWLPEFGKLYRCLCSTPYLFRGGWKRSAIRVHEQEYERYRNNTQGIPIGGEIGVKFIAIGAHNGIPDHQAVLSIIGHGGVLEKTEDSALLNEEYEITKAVVNAKTDPEREAFSEKQKHSLYELTIERRGGISLNIKQQQKP